MAQPGGTPNHGAEMSQSQARATLTAYYAAFNAGDIPAMLDTLHDDFAHHVNEGATRLPVTFRADSSLRPEKPIPQRRWQTRPSKKRADGL